MTKKTRTYHGWIFAEKVAGFKDFFSVQYRDSTDSTRTITFGYGRAAAAVEFFEGMHVKDENGSNVNGMQLGPVKLEKTPLGLRVFTEDDQDL